MNAILQAQNKQVELKKIKSHDDMSDETNCFSAEVWVDGKYLARVSNDGQGGSNNYDFDLTKDGGRWKEFSEWCKALPHDFEFEYEDQVIDNLFQQWAEKEDERKSKAQLRRLCKTKTVFRLKGDPEGSWLTIKHPYDDCVKAHLKAKYGDKVEEVANERT